MTKLSILDLSPIVEGGDARASLRGVLGRVVSRTVYIKAKPDRGKHTHAARRRPGAYAQ